MKRAFILTRILLFVAMAGMLGTAILASRALQQDIGSYRESSRETIYWDTAQLDVDLSLFIATLTRFSLRDATVDLQELNKRFDILWSRASAAGDSVVGEMLRDADEGIGVFPVLTAKLQTHEAAILELDRADDATVRQLIDEFAALRPLVRRLSLHVQDLDRKRYAAIRARLRSSGQLTSIVYNVAIGLAVLLVLVMYIEARRHERIIRETEKLAADARAANRAKSRLVSMIGDELRAPLKGVLGLIGLARQSGLTVAQKRLIAQAEKTGAQMTDLLSDITDYSDLMAGRIDIDEAAFQPAALASVLAAQLGTLAVRSGVTVDVGCAAETPDWVVGDFARLRQALRHLCSRVIENAGAANLAVTLSYERDRLVFRIGVNATDSRGDGQQSVTIIRQGRDEAGYPALVDDDGAEAEALGPLIARGIIALMGGRIGEPKDARDDADMVISIPAQTVAPVRDSVRIRARSETTALLLQATLEEEAWRVWHRNNDPSRVAAILLELPLAEEASIATQLRADHPAARLIAVGPPADLNRFDGMCAGPTDRAALKQALRQSRKPARMA